MRDYQHRLQLRVGEADGGRSVPTGQRWRHSQVCKVRIWKEQNQGAGKETFIFNAWSQTQAPRTGKKQAAVTMHRGSSCRGNQQIDDGLDILQVVQFPPNALQLAPLLSDLKEERMKYLSFFPRLSIAHKARCCALCSQCAIVAPALPHALFANAGILVFTPIAQTLPSNHICNVWQISAAELENTQWFQANLSDLDQYNIKRRKKSECVKSENKLIQNAWNWYQVF